MEALRMEALHVETAYRGSAYGGSTYKGSAYKGFVYGGSTYRGSARYEGPRKIEFPLPIWEKRRFDAKTPPKINLINLIEALDTNISSI